MTRGRSKDHNIPLSRALIQQRDYRARKAKYVSELEERCLRTETENAKLRKELDIAKSGLPVLPAMFTSEAVHAATELIQNLKATSASLARFQQLAYTNHQPSPPVTQNGSNITSSATPSSPISPTNDLFHLPYDEINTQVANLPRLINPSSTTTAVNDTYQPLGASTGSDEECCGGFFDCRFVEDSSPEEDREGVISNPLVNNSNIRSTSDSAPIL